MTTASLPTVLACGAWLKNAACLLVDGAPVWSAVHGDLSDPAACEALAHSVQALLAQAAASGSPVQAIAHDLHPDFFSTQLAIAIAESLGVPAIGVQHHHAHIAAVVAEHGLDGPVIGLALDGVGLGMAADATGQALLVSPSGDGGIDNGFTAWGGELLWLDGAPWQRLGHLVPLALPGGDRAAREPWRMAASALHALGRGNEIPSRFGPVVGDALASGVQQMLARGLNCPATSSTGRWFDAAAGALGLSVRQTDEAQAAMALEAAAARWLAHHHHPLGDATAPLPGPLIDTLPGALIDAHNRLDLRGLMPALFDANADGVDAAAAGFHLALADALAEWALRAARQHGSADVCLSGGCFFNRLLRERVTARLRAARLRVHVPLDKGCGDAGLALGQAWVAAQQLAAIPHTTRTTAPLQAATQEPTPCV